MRNFAAYSVILGLAAAGCARTQAPVAFDTGSMAMPTPQATGEFQRPAPTGIDTGSMASPNIRRPGQTVATAKRRRPDTGSMAYPTPRAPGIVQPDTTQ